MNLVKKSLLALTAGALFLTGCGDDSSTNSTEESSSSVSSSTDVSSSSVSDTTEFTGTEITEPVIEGNISEDSKLLSSVVYELSGFVYVDSGVTLMIEPGTKIASEGKSALIVNPGAKIMAEGTAAQPIVFTSKKATPVAGDWAGVVVFGNSPVSTADQTQGFEANPEDIFGGDDAEDNSGVLKYVRIEYAGYVVATDKELNGLTLGGVGSETEVSYVQVHEGKDDAIEWFGGTANADHIVVTSYNDDGFDIDEGFQGTVKYGLNIQGEGSDHGIEAGSKAVDANHITEPTFENITIIGGGKGSSLIRMKNNVSGMYKKMVLFGNQNASAVKAEGDVTLEKINDGTTVYEDAFYFGTFTEGAVESDDAGAASALTAALTEGDDLLNADYSSKGDAADAGAVVGSDVWYAGWTVAIDPFTASLTDITEPVLTGNITEDSRLTADVTYELSGFVYVEDGVTLVIEPGTKIASEGKSALIVNPGATLLAVGTAANPIVFTSKKETPVTGDWAGLVIFGKSPVSTSDNQQAFEANPTDIFGGTDPEDNSGSLKYVRIEYAGYVVATDKELNGLTLGGVGSNTNISYVQVHEGKDDAIEWFGGTANADHLVVSNYNDDGFDIDEGFQGIVSFGLNIQGPGSDHGIEAGSKAVDANHITEPVFSNITIIAGGKGSAALRLKNNVSGSYTKFVVVADATIESIVKAEGDVTIEKINDGSTELEVFYDGAANITDLAVCDDADALSALEGMVTEATDALNEDYTPKAQAVIDAEAGATTGSAWWADWTMGI